MIGADEVEHFFPSIRDRFWWIDSAQEACFDQVEHRPPSDSESEAVLVRVYVWFQMSSFSSFRSQGIMQRRYRRIEMSWNNLKTFKS